MDNTPEKDVFLIITDISGYTPFMVAHRTALVHGQLIISELTKAIIKQVEIPLEISKLEGDAVFLYAVGEEAKQVGLVDEFGNLPDAIDRAGKLAGIKGKVEAVYPQKEGFSLLRLLIGEEAEETLSNLTLSLPYPEPAFLPTWFK